MTSGSWAARSDGSADPEAVEEATDSSSVARRNDVR